MTAPRKRALEQIPGWTWYHSSQHQHKMDKLRRRHQQQQQQQQQNEGSGTGTGGETRDDGNPYPMNSFDPTNVEQIAHVRYHRQQQAAKSIDPSTFVFTTEDMTQKRYQQWMDRFKVVYQYVRANNGVLPKVTYRNIETDGFDVGRYRCCFFGSLSLSLAAFVCLLCPNTSSPSIVFSNYDVVVISSFFCSCSCCLSGHSFNRNLDTEPT